MPYRSAFLGPLHVVRWTIATAPDARRVVEEVAERRAQHKKGLMHGLAIVGEDVPNPDDQARRAMGESMSQLLEHLETVHVVIEGQGFKNTIMRSAMTGMILIGGKRGRVHIHGSVSSALVALAPVLGTTAEALSRSLSDTRLLEA